jgi:hypothetical protein
VGSGMGDVFDINVSFSQKTAFCPLLCQRGKNTSVLDKEECSTHVGTKLLMACFFTEISHGHLVPSGTSLGKD